MLREPHQRHELRREEERGRKEEDDRHREPVMAPDRDDEALRDRGRHGERSEDQPIFEVRRRGREAEQGGGGRGRDGPDEEGPRLGAELGPQRCWASRPDPPQSDYLVARRIDLRV